MNSIWSETVKIPRYPQLKEDAKTDVLIIGGGMVGVLCAYFLQNAGVSYILAEGNTIGSGITQNTTAKITSQHGLIYHKLLKNAGTEKTKRYLNANQEALDKYRNLCSSIDCNFEEKDAYVYSLNDRQIIDSELSALYEINFNAEFTSQIPLPFNIAGAVKFPAQAQFHPLKFLPAISAGLNIFENTYIKELAPNTAIIQYGKITAKKIIVTTHFPFLNKHVLYFLKMYQHRSYVIALKNAPNINGMYLEEKENGLSFRNHENMLLIGGGDHRTGINGGNWQVLRDFAANTYPESIEKFSWATQDCMTLDGVPYIGQYGKNTDNLYVATGFNKWGMTSSMLSAKILTDMILERKNEYAEIFSPQRSMMKAQLFFGHVAEVLK